MSALGLILALLLVAANGFFVAVEFGLARMRPTKAKELARERRPGGASALHGVENIDAYLAACQLGITLASIGLGVVGEPAFAALLEPLFGDVSEAIGIAVGGVVAYAIITLLHVVLGELAPKSLAIARNERVVLMLAPPMRLFYLVARWPVDFLNMLGNLVLRPFGIPAARDVGSEPHSEDELRALLRESSDEGLIEEEESAISENALVFGDRRAREVMTPRPEIDHLTTRDGVPEAIERVLSTGRTRLPLADPDEGGLDQPLGVIHAKDLLAADESTDLRSIARPLARVSESVLIDELLRVMRRSHQHVALIEDEHGTAVGLATLEDVLEELVGEIEDEFDEDEETQIRRDDGTLVVRGDAPLRLLAEQIGLELDHPHETTVNGHVLERLGRVPGRGERVELEDGAVVEVADVSDARVLEVRVLAKAHSGDDDRDRDGDRDGPGEPD